MDIPAFYFDGKTSRKHIVKLTINNAIVSITGEAEKQYPISVLRISEYVKHAAYRITFPDGAYLEIADNAGFNTLLAHTGYQDTLVVRMQHSWRMALFATVVLAITLVLGYRYLLPTTSRIIANTLPISAQHYIGQGVLEFLDHHMLSPTKLPQQQRDAIIQRFAAMQLPHNNTPTYQIIFRQSKIEPNALALPSNEIVLTDEIIQLIGDNEAIMGVLAHELGHLHERHLMRRIIQSATVGATIAILFGDASTMLTTIPAVMLDLKYSRNVELEADDYAIAMFKKNGISLNKLAQIFEKLDNAPADYSNYLSTHPASQERIERILKADAE